MIPVMIDPRRVRIALIGAGEGAIRRLGLLRDGGAREVAVFAPEPSPALAAAAGDALVRALPDPEWLGSFGLVYIVDLDRPTAERLAQTARGVGALVNVEDVRALCDFHSPAVVRRGDLTLTVSTGGRSPGLAARVRRYLEGLFDEAWADRLEELSDHREAWRAGGHGMPDVATLTDAHVERRGWLR